jgi:hypothetical protein
MLPGGLLRAGELRREVKLEVPTGYLELTIAEAVPASTSLPVRVNAVLARAVAAIGGEPATGEIAEELCVADRQFLMHRIAELLGAGDRWITTTCSACGEPFDFMVRVADLPVREAGASFPFAIVETSVGPLRVRTPTGADQAFIAGLRDARRAARLLLARCLVEPAQAALVDALSPDDIARIEAALEAVSPAVITELAASCPSCEKAQSVPLDPYFILGSRSAHPLEDVHVLAAFYHWSEHDILSLPSDRRRFYLSRVDQARGLSI